MELKYAVKEKSIISELQQKYAVKPWNETQQLVRRCMDKSKGNPGSSQLLLNCLAKLYEAMNACSASALISQLETIAKRRGLGFHLSSTEMVCYVTSDLFYVEVLLSGDGVQAVKLAQHGEAPMSSETLLKLLRLKKYEEFSMKLECLNSFYDLPGDNEIKIKVYSALQCLEKDLIKLSNLPRSLMVSDVHVDTVLNGRAGYIVARREGNPMSIEYYLSPYDILMKTQNTEETTCGHVALVTAGTRDCSQRLPTSSLIPQPPQIDSQGIPGFTPLDEENSVVLPACFLLNLQPPLPMTSSFIHKVQKITGLTLSDGDLKWMPFPQLLLETRLKENGHSGSWENGHAHFVLLPENQTYSYVLSDATDNPASLEGSLVHSIPFLHPSHVPEVLEVLRHQSTFNSLLASCITCYRPHRGSESDVHCEVILEADFGMSLHFFLGERLAVLLVNVEDSRQMSCRLFPRDLTDAFTDDYLSRVLKRCMSIPVTMRAFCRRLTAKPAVKKSPEGPSMAATDDESLAVASTVSSCPALETPVSLPDEEPQDEIAMETSEEVSQNESSMAPATSPCSYYVKSEPSLQSVEAVNTESPSNPYPSACPGIFPTLVY